MPPENSTDGPAAISGKAAELLLEFDPAIYSRDAILRAAHWFSDRFYLVIVREDSTRISVRLRAKTEVFDPERTAAEFHNSLLDAQLRIEIARESAGIRELIVAKA